jgi:signal transduction histidine kinase
LRDSDWLRPQHLPPLNVPDNIRRGLPAGSWETKYHAFYPFRQQAAKRFGEVFSIIAFQSSQDLPSPANEICGSLADALCRRDAVARLFLRQKAMREEFEEHVIDIGHDLGTSSQHVVGYIDALLRASSGAIPPSPDDPRSLRESLKRSVRDHTARIAQLRTPESLGEGAKPESIDLFEEVRRQVELYSITAINKQVTLDTGGLPYSNAYVICERSELARAIAALLDNAIKYSWRDRTVSITGQVGFKMAQLRFQNYGIGIPPSTLPGLKTRKARGEVDDPDHLRPGHGLGFAIAAYVFEELLEGQLEITSKPAGQVPRASGDYSRYLTEVTVRIPVTMD